MDGIKACRVKLVTSLSIYFYLFIQYNFTKIRGQSCFVQNVKNVYFTETYNTRIDKSVNKML